MLKKIILALIISLVSYAAPPEMTFTVEAVEIKPQPFSFTRRYIGVINSEYFSLLKFQTSGTIDEINIKAGQEVKKNQHLFSLDNRPLKEAVVLDQENLNQARKALARARILGRTHDITKVQIEQAESVELAAKRKLSESKKALKNSEVDAPFDGIVGVPRVSLGQSITPEDILVSIQKGYYYATIRIPASRLKEIAVGQPVLVNKEQTQIDAVERSIDPKTRTGFAKAIIKECPRCIVGSSVFADITIENNAQTIMLSRNAIYYEKGEPYVVVVKDDKAHIQKISVGKEQDGLVQVLSGLKPGDLVVKANSKRLRQGAKLKVL